MSHSLRFIHFLFYYYLYLLRDHNVLYRHLPRQLLPRLPRGPGPQPRLLFVQAVLVHVQPISFSDIVNKEGAGDLGTAGTFDSRYHVQPISVTWEKLTFQSVSIKIFTCYVSIFQFSGLLLKSLSNF